MATKRKKKPSNNNTKIKTTSTKEISPTISHERTPVIVAIGASAGGLEMFEQLFAAMPEQTGLAFVVITHLDPNHKTIMPELIQNYSDMKVISIQDNMRVKPNVIYVIPPNAKVSIEKSTLFLNKIKDNEHINLPINYFLESLAADRKENAIAIILSGNGSDGVAGLKAIKCEGGMVIAQDPLTAKYVGMPQSAINTGLVDYILPVEKIPDILIKISHREELKEIKITPELQQIFKILRTHTGHDFASYKLNTIYRRIERQMHAHHVKTLAEYVKFLRIHPNEVNSLFKDFLIGVTRFFRDSEAFETLKHKILPQLLKTKPEEYCIRVWVPGCATGEEVYSLAIILREILDEMKYYFNVQIFGTDIDQHALELARAGVYPESISNEISHERLKRFFIKEKNTYKVKKEIREMIVFGVQNIIKDPPFTKLDLICCRNLLIYFNTQLQKKLLPIFHFSLKPNGVLFLGTSEAIAGYDDLFRLLDQKWKIFERKDANSYPYGGFEFSTVPNQENNNIKPVTEIVTSSEKNNLAESINNFLIDNYSPSCLIINKKGLILYSHGKAEKIVELTTKKGDDINLFDVVTPKIKTKLVIATRKVLTQQKKVTLNKVSIRHPRSRPIIVNLKISPILDHVSMYGLLFIIVEEAIIPKLIKATKEKYASLNKMSKKIIELEDELQFSKENLQTTIEELQSSNEELQSTNEELQSTNEEIETSKEELQSLNEELVTVNAELQDKIDQLASINDDMNNLFDSTEVLAIFLDNDLNVKRFTPKVKDLVSLIPTDIGRSIGHFAINIKYENIINDAKEVLKSLVPKAFEVQDKDNKYYHVRILPYRTLTNSIDGVIVTFTDINNYKKLAVELTEANKVLNDSLNFTKCVLSSFCQPLLVIDESANILEANDAFYDLFKIKSSEVTGNNFYNISKGIWDIPLLRKEITNMLKHETKKKELKIANTFPGLGKTSLNITICRIFSDTFDSNNILLTMEKENNG